MGQGMFRIKPSSFIEGTVRIPVAGRIDPIRFSTRRHLPAIYNDSRKHILLKFGRQTEKSTTIGNIALANTVLHPFFRTLIVHPSATNSKTFSEDRISLPIKLSPYLRQLFPKNSQSIFHKRAINNSSIMFRYAFLSAARIRGIPADMLVIDEFQDILSDLVPIIEQVCFHSPHKYYIYSGTPLSEENIIERQWRNSTMNEYVFPCRKHGTPKNRSSWYWNILTTKNIGKTGIICDKCGASLNVNDPDATWVKTQTGDHLHWTGYHLPQIAMPFTNEPQNWKEILRKYDDYKKELFMNEVMGESCSSAEVPLTQDEVISVCQENIRFAHLDEYVSKCRGRAYMGIDWGTGEADSYTVICIGGYLEGSDKFQIFFVHRFTGKDTEANAYLEKIARMLAVLKITHIGTDYGGGEIQNGWLLRQYGLSRVHRYQYVGRQRSGKIVHNEVMGRYLLSRGEAITDYINAIKHEQILLPNKEDLEKAGVFKDFCSQRAEYNHIRRYMKFDRVRGIPDDGFHAGLYCFLASIFDVPRPDIITPRPEIIGGEAMDIIKAMDAADGLLPGADYY